MLQAVSDLFSWIFTVLPDFIMHPAVVYYFALFFVLAVVALLRAIINISR